MPRFLSVFWILALVVGFAAGNGAASLGGPANESGHWAYRELVKPAIPKVEFGGEDAGAIDAFILRKLREAGLELSPLAEDRTLIRRAYYDLIGLPPSYEEVEAFAEDERPEAYAELIDRLLASPQYGERWGRHWLDVARYADTKDLVLQYGKDRLRPYAYTYRDYVVRAFNEDTPFNQFIREQIAADLIEPEVERWRLAALGFLTLGRLYDNNPHDQIDDQIDTVTRGFLGLTVACARCHDHKYDAIPTQDYYALYGVFASSERPYDLPLIEDPAQVEGGVEFEQKLAEARQKLEAHVESEYENLQKVARERTPDYLVKAATTEPDLAESSSFFLSLAPEDLRPGLLNKWRRYVRERAAPDHPVFGAWFELMRLPEDGFRERAAAVLKGGASRGWNALLVEALVKAAPGKKADAARVYGERIYAAYERAHAPAVEGQETSEISDAEKQLAAILSGAQAPTYFRKNQTYLFMSRVEVDRYHGLVSELDKVAAKAEKRPPARAMVVRDADEPYAPRVFVRGSPAQLGEPVERRFLSVLAPEGEAFEHGSGRLELANAIGSPENPLTARVFVNRVWMHHFGQPLVSSPSDFGTRSEEPTHPELLDYLAANLIEQGWSLKKLHREIMLSHAYQQASGDRAEARTVDPGNELFWRSNRRRLDLESMRDTLLKVSGRLDASMGGPAVDVAHDPMNTRRTLYGLIDRQDLPALYRAFDFVCPDQSVEKRPVTNVPQQALFAMNSPFVMEQARALVARPEVDAENAPEARIKALYQLVLSRRPTDQEVKRALEFIAAEQSGAGDNTLPVWEQFAQVLLMTNELMFID